MAVVTRDEIDLTVLTLIFCISLSASVTLTPLTTFTFIVITVFHCVLYRGEGGLISS